MAHNEYPSGALIVDGIEVRVNFIKDSAHVESIVSQMEGQVDSGTVDQIVTATIHKKLDKLQNVQTIGRDFSEIRQILKTNIDEALTQGETLSLVWVIRSGNIHFDLFR